MAEHEDHGQHRQANHEEHGGEKEHGDDKPKLHSDTPENATGQLNPSAPANTGITPGTSGDVG